MPQLITPIAPGPATPSRTGLRFRPRIVTAPGLPPVVIPTRSASRNGYDERIKRCVHYGIAAGVPIDEIARFTVHCLQ